ncbi:MAG: nucleoside triphosphate pyrophosphohydrolase, partial [Candidatus Omnitrophica bacterium]|nr:nucleoside triphosphate pyrophosphohydrolase [Candidatus Omnitrophota bacterium]
MSEIGTRFERLCEIMRTLRGPGGCPWDREQTHSSLTRYLIEEAYEVADAVEEKDDEELKKELGDVLLQVVFHSEIAEGEGRFDIQGVIDSINEKMIRRHPHVFGDTTAEDSEAVLAQWHEIKQKERGEQASILDGVPRSLPALSRAETIQKRAARVGFDWSDEREIRHKVHEELDELAEALEKGEEASVQEEFGDLLFALVNWARFNDIDSEQALDRCNQKFLNRFRFIES